MAQIMAVTGHKSASAQYFPVATHAADTKQFKFNIICSNESQYILIQ
jgi:hypothetical protein